MTEPVSFWVDGEPKAQPRPRAFARKFGNKWSARVYNPATAEAWKSAIAVAAKPHLKTFHGPVKLVLMLNFRRPKSHARANGNVKPNAPSLHTTKPDCENVAKACMDALTVLGFWKDDKQVAALSVTKMYTIGFGSPGTRIEISEWA